ncbi:hypothetical protein [Lactobacillus xylocopicola]|uniref:Uncharacterized protein n=1 Tax=Lactobacillus xylocopicola TaxID=2976676 RepID=A0ABN6SNR1_9LACO|nr:hypothetical protein [Lactobacillus xylocopicola]BDR60856.1 hypothetical protein KIM322_11170 [Lactobacillus xylocopicola]
MLFKKQVQGMSLCWQTWLALVIGLVLVIIQAGTMRVGCSSNNAFMHLTGFNSSGWGTLMYYTRYCLSCAA